MKTFKQFLKESKIDSEYDSSLKIGFESIGSGFEVQIEPMERKFGYDDPIHQMRFNVFSSGTSYYIKPTTEEEVELAQKAIDGSIDPKKGPYYLEKIKMKKVMKDEIFKAANEFDKKIVSIMKKYGYEKRK